MNTLVIVMLKVGGIVDELLSIGCIALLLNIIYIGIVWLAIIPTFKVVLLVLSLF